MSMEQNDTMRQHDREKALYCYSTALERGDFDTVSQVLQQAEVDPELEHMLMELNAEYRAEFEAVNRVQANAADLVRKLLRQHLPSGFGSDDEAIPPLTVGDVVSRLEVSQQTTALDPQALQLLRGNKRVLPEQITARSLAALAAELGVAANDRFWRAFQKAAIALGLAHSQNEMHLAATREQRIRQQRSGKATPPADNREETAE